HSRYRFRSSRGGEPRTLLSPPSPVLLAAAASPEIYTLSLHDALPILSVRLAVKGFLQGRRRIQVMLLRAVEPIRQRRACHPRMRSEERTSELQSLRHLVCRLLLEKKQSGQRPGDAERGIVPQERAFEL